MGFRETTRLDAMADAARDWQVARLIDAGRTGQTLTDEDYDDMVDAASDWWAGLTDAERAEAESEYFENCSDEVNSCWSYLDIFRAMAEGHLVGKRAYDPLAEWRALGTIPRYISGVKRIIAKHHQGKTIDTAVADNRCKLTPQQVKWLREHYDGFMTMRMLADFCGLSVSTVSNILNGKYWKDGK